MKTSTAQLIQRKTTRLQQISSQQGVAKLIGTYAQIELLVCDLLQNEPCQSTYWQSWRSQKSIITKRWQQARFFVDKRPDPATKTDYSLEYLISFERLKEAICGAVVHLPL
ncbi:hypothetical protein GO755_00385 [Spirosoma sp. HMF4905]|uniref:Uncharacterized protein n=1 Tax=Spirosoma arboris TaxID=2682092 RepID=A0A7K1S4G7_9BACT|nr:hypothetical protein [Spirosoma arboris]MVM28468.1 hypothetical protein [Spirosoma arboris]